jgi:hypothetical protein
MPVTLVQSQGCVLKMSATSYALGATVVAPTVVITGVTSISAPSNESMDIDVTTFATSGIREYIKSAVREGGEVTVGLLFDVAASAPPAVSTGNVAIISGALGDATNLVRQFSIDDGATTPNVIILFQGYIKSFKGPNLEKDGVATAELVIKLSGGTINLA